MKTSTVMKLARAVASLALVRGVLRLRRRFDPRGKVVVIAGGARGLGLVLARKLVERGARVALGARDAGELSRARHDLEDLGGDVYTAFCDVTHRADVRRFIAEVEADFGPIEVLVNNAGTIQVGPIEDVTEADFDLALDVNLRGPLHAIYAVLPGMRRRQRGRIVNIASVGDEVAAPPLAAYSTSKFGLVGLSEALRAELAKNEIYVTTVCPLTSVGAERAAEQIIRALVRGDAEVSVSPRTRLITWLHGLAPGLVQELLGAVNRVLPKPTAAPVVAAARDARSHLAARLSLRNDLAALRNNEC